MPKEINANVSSMVDLKAELFRKHQQKRQFDSSNAANASKQLFVKGSNHDPLIMTKAEEKQKSLETSDRQTRIKALEEELRKEIERERKVKESLATKALLYDRLAQGDTVAFADGTDIEFMVDFGKKSRENAVELDEQMIEYTDTFGRLKHCWKSDLSRCIEAELKIAKETLLEKQTVESSQNEQFEQEGPVGPVHYSNVAINEPREFGVSHFKFDPNEELRKAQMTALDELRHKTIDFRDKNEQIRRKREILMASRLEKVRKRKQLEPDPQLDEILDTKDDKFPVTESNLPPIVEEIPPIVKKPSVRPWDRGKNTCNLGSPLHI